MGKTIEAAILGASGYTGAELVRLLDGHPFVHIRALTADRNAGQPLAAVFPHLSHLTLPELVRIEDVPWDDIEVVFCALPHGTVQPVLAGLPRHLRIVDLSADFRFDNMDTYAAWYGHPHEAPALQAEAAYGLTELYRSAIVNARLVANPGCYPTAALLAILPLVRAGVISPDEIILDAKSGVSGAGRSLKTHLLHGEVDEGFQAYGVGAHRHMPEIEEKLGQVCGRRDLRVSFTPHLIPVNRGELITANLRLSDGATADDVRATLQQACAQEPFIHVVAPGMVPSTRHVRGSNMTFLGVEADRLPGRVLVLSAIDNLVKGASGQAVQNLNVMTHMPEALGLPRVAMVP